VLSPQNLRPEPEDRTARPPGRILEMSGAFLECTLGPSHLRLLLRRLSSTLRATGST
jgi:hypothetical protein